MLEIDKQVSDRRPVWLVEEYKEFHQLDSHVLQSNIDEKSLYFLCKISVFS